jgi:hypothetical protein
MRTASFALLLCFVAVSGAWAQEPNAWEDFLRDPSRANFGICEAQARDSLSGKYTHSQSPAFRQLKEGNLEKVLALGEAGNAYASELSFQVFPLFREYPDIQGRINVSRSKLIRKNPELFLRLMAKYERSPEGTDSIVRSYGVEYGEQWELLRGETEKRIEALRQVEKYEDVKARCIASLEGVLDQLMQVRHRVRRGQVDEDALRRLSIR